MPDCSCPGQPRRRSSTVPRSTETSRIGEPEVADVVCRSLDLQSEVTHEQRDQSENEAVKRREIGRSLPRTIANEQWCFSGSDSATTVRKPLGRSSFAEVTSKWMTRIRSSRTERNYHGC